MTLRGNPIGLNTKNDYRVLLLDVIPSVLMLDGKKIRSAVKHRSTESGGATGSAKSLSYCTYLCQFCTNTLMPHRVRLGLVTEWYFLAVLQRACTMTGSSS